MRCNHPLWCVLLTLVCCFLMAEERACSTQPQDKKSDPTDSGNLFKWFAKGKDTIVIAEVPPLRGKEEMELFARENGITNGQLTQEQFPNFFKQLEELRKKTAKDPQKIALEKQAAEQAVDAQAERIFRFYDFNGDNYWNAYEIGKLPNDLAAFKDEWKKWDADKDDLIDLNEFKSYYRDYTKLRKESQANPKGDKNQTNAQPDPKGDKGQTNAQPDPKAKENQTNPKTDPIDPIKIFIEEDGDAERTVYHHGAKLPKGLPKWFKELDLNKDGQVSLYEWQKGGRDLEEFATMDRNDDALLTAEEVLRYLKQTNGLQPSGDAQFPKRHHESVPVRNLKDLQESLNAQLIKRFRENQINASPKPIANKIQADTKPDPKNLTKIYIEEDQDDARPVYHYGAKPPAGLPKWFVELDLDKDGQISLHEWREGERNFEEFVKMDRNADGRLTAEEVLRYLKQPLRLSPTGQLHIQDTIEEQAEERYRGRKAFKVFTIQLEQGKTYQFDFISEVFFAYLNLEDAEGKILDKHNSGGLNLVSRIVHQATETGTYRLIATSQDGIKSGAFTLTVRVISRRGGVAQTALPSWFKDLDKNEDGQVSLAEWLKGGKGLDEFAEFDLNGDGLITAAEVLRDAKKKLHLKLDHGLASYSSILEGAGAEKYRGKKSYQILTIQLEQGRTYQIDHMSKAFDAYLYLEDSEGELLAQDDDGGEGLNSRIVFRPNQTGTYRLIATCLGDPRPGAFSLTVRVVNQIGGTPMKGLPSWFKDLDKNKDGQVSLQDWSKSGKKLDEFAEYDRNDDGFITEEEVLRYLNNKLDLKLENGQASYSGTLVETPDDRYRGKKSFQILTIQLEQGKTYQIDHKSKMFQAFLFLENSEGKVLKMHSSRTIGDNSRIVFRADQAGIYRIIATSLGGFRTGDYLLSVRVEDQLGLPPWFNELDKNKDGQVSLQEWLEAGRNLDDFTAFDRNDDGFISAEEVLRYLKK